MAAKASTTAVNVPGEIPNIPQGVEVAVFEKGIDLFERLKLNGEVELKLTNGRTVTGTVRGMKVDTLVDLLQMYGPQSIYTYARLYSAVGLIQALTDAAGGSVLDVTKLYTAVVVSLPYDPNPV